MSGHHTPTGVLLALLTFSAPASVLAAPSEGMATMASSSAMEPAAAVPRAPAAAPQANADATSVKPPTHHFEVGAFLGATWYPNALALDAGVVSDRTFGFGGALSLAYRGPFFLYPFVDLGYFDLAGSTIHTVSSSGIGSDKVKDHLGVWTFVFGPGWDIGPIRLRAGVGLDKLMQTATGPGFDDTVRPLGFATTLIVSGTVLQTQTLRLGIEARATHFVYAGSTMLALGVSGAADFLSW